MPNCTQKEMDFGRVGRRVIEANFDGGALSSDGGLLLLKQTDRRIGLSHAVATALNDPRDRSRITHEWHHIIRCAISTSSLQTPWPLHSCF